MYQDYVLPVFVSKIAQSFSKTGEIAPFFLSATGMPQNSNPRDFRCLLRFHS